MGAAASVSELCEFDVELQAQPETMKPKLPPTFKVKLSDECIEIYDKKTHKLLCNIVYTDIESWTKLNSMFSINLTPKVLNTPGKACITFTLAEEKAKALQKNILSKIKLLMERMEKEGYTIALFADMLKSLLDGGRNLKPEWIELLGTEKKLTAFQALDIYKHLRSQSEFDRMDSICHLYTLLLNKSMFQILVNALDEEGERENVLHRLNLHRNEGITRDGSNLSSTVRSMSDAPPVESAEVAPPKNMP